MRKVEHRLRVRADDAERSCATCCQSFIVLNVQLAEEVIGNGFDLVLQVIRARGCRWRRRLKRVANLSLLTATFLCRLHNDEAGFDDDLSEDELTTTECVKLMYQP
jgi:hypothetical protein